MFSDPNTEITSAYTCSTLSREGRAETRDAQHNAHKQQAEQQRRSSAAISKLRGQGSRSRGSARGSRSSITTQCCQKPSLSVTALNLEEPWREEGRREQTEWRVKHKARSLASELVINHLKWYVLADFRVIFSFSLAEHEFHRSLEPTATLDLLALVSLS